MPRFGWAGALRRAGYARDAREPLRSAVDLAVRCGAAAVARQARDELIATGGRGPVSQVGGADRHPERRGVGRASLFGVTKEET
jgi:hypothetical protein